MCALAVSFVARLSEDSGLPEVDIQEVGDQVWE